MDTHPSILTGRILWTKEPGSPGGCKELDMTEPLSPTQGNKGEMPIVSTRGSHMDQSSKAQCHNSLTFILVFQGYHNKVLQTE